MATSRRRWPWLLAGAILLVAGAAGAANRALLRTPADALPTHRALRIFARIESAPSFERHCAACHGADGRGRADKGAPDLVDDRWLYGTGQVSEIERTILFGIRAGDARGRNVADMPAFLFEGRLDRREIALVTEYVLSLAGRPHVADAVAEGRAIFRGKGVCYDCHGLDGGGQPDFGAPSLRRLDLSRGTSRKAIRRSVAEGRHGLCPAWVDRIGAAHIRAIALSLHDGHV